MADLNWFNSDNYEPTDFAPIAAGRYKAVITKSEFKSTKKKDGTYLELELQIIEGEHKNRKLWDRLNVHNPNEMAVKIARGTLTSICLACNKPHPKDTSELHNIPLMIGVKVSKNSETGDLTNEINKYAPITEGAHQGVTQQAAPPEQLPEKPKKPPWEK